MSEKGYGTESLNVPIVSEGKIDFLDDTFMCSMRNFWTKIESELLLEGKTLECLHAVSYTHLTLPTNREV